MPTNAIAPIDKSLIEVSDYTGTGYQPLVDFGAWRVAILRYHDELLPENIGQLQRHDETDEIFVLLAGKCILFIGDGTDQVTGIQAVDMQPLKLYNVKRAAWHSHTLSQDASVLIVENRDTANENSPVADLSVAQRASLVQMTQALWK